MNLHKLKIRRMEAMVRVSGEPDVIAWVRNRGSRYFELDAQFGDHGIWHIIAGKENAPPLPWHYLERGIPGAPCVFLFNVTHKTIVIDATPGPWRKLWTLRLVRDLLRWQMFHQGAVFIHASVVCHNSAGIALVGTKRSGKSTILLKLLRNTDFGFVAEDDLTVVRKPDGTLSALGWPSCLRIRRCMLNHFPELSEDSDFAHPANNLEKAGDAEIALLRLFPEELTPRFKSFSLPEITLNAVVSLRWDKKENLSRLSSNGTAKALIEAWDILPERRPGARPQFASGSNHEWRDCCFNPPLYDFFGTPKDLSTKSLYEIASTVSGYVFDHDGNPERLRQHLGHLMQHP
ncbi:MAG: hypothetical protein AAB370_11085 [Verrucomicrobiota bacterium]